MKFRQALARGFSFAAVLAALVVVAAALGVGFDGIGDSRWAIACLSLVAAICWFDRPPVIGAASIARPSVIARLSGLGLLLTTALVAAWLGPRTIDKTPDRTPVEAWSRDDSIGPDWPTLYVHGQFPTRVADELGAGRSDQDGRTWTLTPSALPPEQPKILRPRHNPPVDEPAIALAVPPTQLRISGIPPDRRGGDWLKRLWSKHANRLLFDDGGSSIGRALPGTKPPAPFPVGGTALSYRIAKPFTRAALAWSAGDMSIRAEAGHLLPVAAPLGQVPPGSTPLVGLNTGLGQFMPLVPVLVDDQGQLSAVRVAEVADEPIAIDLLGEGQSETGPAILEAWLRETRSRAASAPGLVVVPQELPWRRAFAGTEVVWSRGAPRPTPRPDESIGGLETLMAAVAGLMLVRLALQED